MGKRWEGRRWADDYDFDTRDTHTRMFVAASNWMDRALQAERKLKMETITQPKSTGDRQLNESEAALINAVKKSGEQLDALLATISAYLENQATRPDPDESSRLELAQPRRWLAIGHTDIQTGLMALVRAIAQPTGL